MLPFFDIYRWGGIVNDSMICLPPCMIILMGNADYLGMGRCFQVCDSSSKVFDPC